MKHHQEHVDNLAKFLKERKTDYKENEKLNDKHRIFIMCILLHLSDISNPLKQFDIALKWGLRVFTEFFEQGDEEMDLGIPQSPLCDRENASIINGQIGFSRFVVLPLIEQMIILFPEFILFKQNLLKNCRIYTKITEIANEHDIQLNTIKDIEELLENENTVFSVSSSPIPTSRNASLQMKDNPVVNQDKHGKMCTSCIIV